MWQRRIHHRQELYKLNKAQLYRSQVLIISLVVLGNVHIVCSFYKQRFVFGDRIFGAELSNH